MKKIITQNFLSRGIMIAALFVLLFGIQNAEAAITSHLDLGDKGSDVSQLQVYLAQNASIYPSGLVTGYFGPLTAAAVQKFQVAQGLVSSGTPATTGYGRVGAQTMARLNALMGSGNPQVSWDTVPVLSAPFVQPTNNSANFSWSSNEPTQGQLYYNTSPLITDEATGPLQQPYISGTFALDNGGFQINHNLSIQNLQSNTLYYYVTRGIDGAGNVTMTWPSIFRTNQ